MNKILILMAIMLNNTFAATVPGDWLLKPTKIDKADNSNNLREQLDELLDLNGEALEEFDGLKTLNNKSNAEKKFKLTEVITFLGVSASGTIGPLGLSGEAATELHWAKRENKIVSKKWKRADLYLSNNTTEIQIKENIGPLIEGLVKSKKVKNKELLRTNLLKAASNFQNTMSGIKIERPSELGLTAIQANIGIETSGNINIITIGGGIELTFEWSFNQEVNSDVILTNTQNTNENELQKNIENLIKILGEEVALSSNNFQKLGNFKTDYIQIGLALGIEGEVGVASAGASVGMSLIFTPINSTNNKINMSVNDEEMINIIGRDSNKILSDRRNTKLQKVARKKLRKALEKSFRISRFFVKRADKRIDRLEKKGKRPKYGLSAITQSFEISLSGGIGIVTVSGTPSLEMEFSRENF